MELKWPLSKFLQGQIGHWQLANILSFTPLALFTLGEQGVWYDPSDLSTLFQDAAGTTPVTAVGQPVGRMLDKSGNGNHATQSTAASRPILRLNATTGAYYLETDGVDDSLVTASINFTGTDKVSVFAGVTALNLASSAIGFIANFGSTGAGGHFFIAAPSSPGVMGAQYSASVGVVFTGESGLASPLTAVISASMNIAAPLITFRRDGIVRSSNAASPGTGTFANAILSIGRQANLSQRFFSGHCYGLIIRGALTDDPTTVKVEKFLAGKTGVTLV